MEKIESELEMLKRYNEQLKEHILLLERVKSLEQNPTIYIPYYTPYYIPYITRPLPEITCTTEQKMTYTTNTVV